VLRKPAVWMVLILLWATALATAVLVAAAIGIGSLGFHPDNLNRNRLVIGLGGLLVGGIDFAWRASQRRAGMVWRWLSPFEGACLFFLPGWMLGGILAVCSAVGLFLWPGDQMACRASRRPVLCPRGPVDTSSCPRVACPPVAVTSDVKQGREIMIVALIGLLIGTDARSEEMLRAGAVRPLPPITEENAARVKEGMTLRQVIEILGPERNDACKDALVLRGCWEVGFGVWEGRSCGALAGLGRQGDHGHCPV